MSNIRYMAYFSIYYILYNQKQWVFAIKYIGGISQVINIVVTLQHFAVETTAVHRMNKCYSQTPSPSSSGEAHGYHSKTRDFSMWKLNLKN